MIGENHVLVIDAGGDVRHIYADELQPMDLRLGDASIDRASHVEPDGLGSWTADMAPVGGPALGPYLDRKTALIAEHLWLEARDIPRVQS